MKQKVLFVCLGNICRSPSAEAVFTKLVNDAGLANDILIDSAGTIAVHAGERADSRMQQHASKRGINLSSISRKVQPSDFEQFDLIVGMDDSNISDLLDLTQNETQAAKVVKMTDYCSKYNHTSVPDPYYGGSAGFELVLDLLDDACSGLLEEVKTKL